MGKDAIFETALGVRKKPGDLISRRRREIDKQGGALQRGRVSRD